MEGITNQCSVEVSWSIEDLADIRQHVVYRLEDEVGSNDDKQEPSLDVKQLMCLRSETGSNEPCLIKCKCVSPGAVSISAVDILCSARHMEVFTKHGEYIDTCRGICVDDAVDSLHHAESLFLLQHTFNEPTSLASFKLVVGKNVSVVMLHSIHITVSQSDVKPVNFFQVAREMAGVKNIDVDRVSSRLADMDIEVPPEAQQLMNMMKQQSKSRETQPSHPPPTLASMMSMLSSIQTPTPTAATNKATGSYTPPSSPSASLPQKPSPRMNRSALDLNSILTEMTEMEKRIITHFDRQLADFEHRINRRIDSLAQTVNERTNSLPDIALD